MTIVSEMRALLAKGALDLAPVGEGRTAERWDRLVDIARHDVSVARLVEAHVDGRQILREAKINHGRDRLLGVWASDHPRHTLRVESSSGAARLQGSKAFCTGAGIVDDALVTVATADGPMMFVIAVDTLESERIDTSSWRAPALAATQTAVVDFDGLEIDLDAGVGGPGWYLDRPGFWHGAIGPAACWAGAAIGLVDSACASPPTDPHGLAHLGGLVAARWSMINALATAGSQIDANPFDVGAAHQRALIVRHIVDDCCRDIQDRFGRALGPRPLVNDGEIAERNEALTIYRRQCHAERDLEALGALLTE